MEWASNRTAQGKPANISFGARFVVVPDGEAEFRASLGRRS
jgi:hypothetical protein